MNQNIYKERNIVVPVNISEATGVPDLTLRKNWRLVQLMTALESGFASIQNSLDCSGQVATSKTSKNKQVRSYFKKFLFARPYKTLCKITIPEVKYKNIYITNPIASQVLHGTRNPVVIKACNSRGDTATPELSSYSDFTYKPERSITYSPVAAVGELDNFPIKANFVAQWLSENIVSSKTYKLSLLCDRVIKASFLSPSGVGKSVFSTISDKVNAETPDLEKTSNTHSVSELILVGIKIIISGRILGAEIATSKTFKAGQIPNNTITILKDRGFALAKTRSGTIGVKVIYFWSKA